MKSTTNKAQTKARKRNVVNARRNDWSTYPRKENWKPRDYMRGV